MGNNDNNNIYRHLLSNNSTPVTFTTQADATLLKTYIPSKYELQSIRINEGSD